MSNNAPIRLMTIGCGKTSAERFFTRLADAGVKRLIDVRLSNQSQLAGFSKRDDLRYFTRVICGAEYVHLPQLAPSSALFEAIKQTDDWVAYEKGFFDLMAHRRIEQTISRELFQDGCLLCSEAAPEYCHRRLVAEYLQQHWGGINLTHL